MDVRISTPELAAGRDKDPYRTLFRKDLKPPPGSGFGYSVKAYQLEADSPTKVLQFGGKSTDGQQELNPVGLEIDYASDQLTVEIAEISAKILAHVPGSMGSLAETIYDVLRKDPDLDDKRLLHQRIVDELAPRIDQRVLARYPLDKIDFSDLMGFKLEPKNAGISETVPLDRYQLQVNAPEGQKVDLDVAVWERAKDPAYIAGEFPAPHQRSEEVVLISGLASGALELPLYFHGFGDHFPKLVSIGHADAPSSEITPHNRPLNELTLQNSGIVLLNAIESLVARGTLTPGKVALSAYSTGGAVALEAAAEDVRRTDADPNRKRAIDKLILLSPAGMMENPDVAKGAAGAMLPYLGQHLGDHLRSLLFQATYVLPDKFRPLVGLKTRLQNVSSSPPEQQDRRISWQQLLEFKRLAETNEAWKSIRLQNIIFDFVEMAASHLPVGDFIDRFHRVWSFQQPHLVPANPTTERNTELVSHDITKSACAAIKDTDTYIMLFEGDRAIPPEGFLNDQDRSDLARIQEGQISHVLGELKEETEWLQKTHRERNPGSQTLSEDEIAREISPHAFDLIRQDRIIKRVKEHFPANDENVRVLISHGHHIVPKVEAQLAADFIASAMDRRDKNKPVRE